MLGVSRKGYIGLLVGKPRHERVIGTVATMSYAVARGAVQIVRVHGVLLLILLVRESHLGARMLAIGAVASVVIAWGVAQWPYMLPTSLKVSQAAAPDATLTAILVVFGIAAVVILPSLGLLYMLDQKSMLETGTDDAVTARGCADQAAALVAEADREPVDLELGEVADRP